MNCSAKPTKKNRHIEKRHFYGLQEFNAGNVFYFYVDTNHCVSDVGTKNLTTDEASPKLSVMEVPATDDSIGILHTDPLHAFGSSLN